MYKRIKKVDKTTANKLGEEQMLSLRKLKKITLKNYKFDGN